MVSFEEISDESSNAATTTVASAPLAPWQERLLDAEEIMSAAATVKRPTARMQLEALGKRLQKESDALKRVEKSRQMTSDEKEEDISNPTSTAASASAAPVAPAPAPKPLSQPASPPVVSRSMKYVPIDRFAFDAGGYNAPFVTLYVDLPGVGSIPRENIQCDFKTASFDLIVKDLRGKSYRLFKDGLEKDLDTGKCKTVVKADKIIIKLAKVKQSEYGGFDYWSKLTDTKKGDAKAKKEDPQSSIMNMMKQMYDEGDDSMKKIIGETMMKQQRGELGGDKNKKGGLGLGDDMDDF